MRPEGSGRDGDPINFSNPGPLCQGNQFATDLPQPAFRLQKLPLTHGGESQSPVDGQQVGRAAKVQENGVVQGEGIHGLPSRGDGQPLLAMVGVDHRVTRSQKCDRLTGGSDSPSGGQESTEAHHHTPVQGHSTERSVAEGVVIVLPCEVGAADLIL